MIWVMLIATVAVAAYSYYEASKATNQAQQLQQIKGPTAAEGIGIPVLFGRRVITNPNVTWYGGQKTAIQSDKSTKYYLGVQFALCHGQLDRLNDIYLAESETTFINTIGFTQGVSSDRDNVSLTDIVQATGGWQLPQTLQGTVWVRMGAVNTGENVVAGIPTYVNRAMGQILDGSGKAIGPKYYGVAMVESNNDALYLGKSPQIAPLSFDCTRIHTRKGGSVAQWYDAKAEIKLGRDREDSWKYKLCAATDPTDYSVPSYDDSAWPESHGGFGNAPADYLAYPNVTPGNPNGYPVPVVKTHLSATDWPGLVSPNPYMNPWVQEAAQLWLRKDLGPMPKQDIGVQLWHDDVGELWFNGSSVAVTATVDPSNKDLEHFNSTAVIPASLVNVNGPNVVAYKVTDSYRGSTRVGTNRFIYAGIQVGLDVTNPRKTVDMNPVHIIREVLTDDIWGPGYPESDMGTSFTAAADTCYAENLGLSMLWDEQQSYMDFIAEILRYISGVLYIDPLTGHFEIKLIRDNYTVGDLPVFDETNTSTIEDAERKAVGEIVNQVTATYSVNPRGKQGSVTVFDQGLIASQGLVSHKSDYPWVSTSFIAGRLALRDMRVLSAPLLSCTVRANRAAATLRPGDAFVLNRPDVGISNMVMRIGEIDIGDGINNECTIKAAEDVFYFPASPLNKPNPPISRPPATVTVPSAFDSYWTEQTIDVRNKGMCEVVFTSGSSEASLLGEFVETPAGSGVYIRNATGALSDSFFDGINPFTGGSGSGVGNGETWMVGRKVFALAPMNFGDNYSAQGPYIVDDIGGHYENHGTPEQAWVPTYAKLHRDPAFASSADFSKDMVFQIRMGSTYALDFFQLDTPNVVLGATEQHWTKHDGPTFAFVDEKKLLRADQLQTENVSPESTLYVQATMVHGISAFDGFETIAGTPGVTSIPAGLWKFGPATIQILGGDADQVTTVGFQVFQDTGVGGKTLFEVQSGAIDVSTDLHTLDVLSYQAPQIPMAATDRIVVIPMMHTTSYTPVTILLWYNGLNAIQVQIPKATDTGNVTSAPDEGWYDVNIDANGLISGFSSHRKLRVHGTGPLKGIATTGLVGGVSLILGFVDNVIIDADNAPTGGARLLTSKDGEVDYQDRFCAADSLAQVSLITDSGTSAFWKTT